MKRSSVALVLCLVSVVVLSACGGGGKSSADKTATAAAPGATGSTPTRSAASRTSSAAAGKSSTAAANTPAPGSSAAAVATAIASTPGAAETLAAAGTTPDAPGSTPADAGTPVPGETPAAGSTIATGPPTVSDAEATLSAAVPPEIYGGDPHDPPHVVGNVPTPPSGATIDSREIAPPNPPDNTRQLIVDMDASKPGIQSSRDVKVGDVFRVGIVVVNAPVYQNNTGGVSTVEFTLNYDRTKLIAPTIEGGSSTDRNPDLNTAALGEDAQWACLPAPQGDLDDPNGQPGDGDPTTGQAFLSCFTPGLGHQSGTIVLATIEFHAIASGTSQFKLSDLQITDVVGFAFYCDGDPTGDDVPCRSGSVNIR